MNFTAKMISVSFYSHLERDEEGNIVFKKMLHEHLIEVSDSAKIFIRNANVKDPALEKLAFITGIAHDFGKYTSFFQDYLVNGNDTGTLKNHSLLSAFWGAFLVFHRNQKSFFDVLLVFNVILNHHGNLEDFSELLKNLADLANPFLKDFINQEYHRKFSILFNRQLNDLRDHLKAINDDLSKVHQDIPSVERFLEEFTIGKSTFFQFLMEANNDYQKMLKSQTCSDFNFKRYLLFSALIDADKRDAGKIQNEIHRKQIPENIVQIFVDQELGGKRVKLSPLREKLFDELKEQAQSIDLNKHIFTLSAPTGSGKTLSVLSFTLILKRRLHDETGLNPRIIYVLPFTSIIDQNFDVFRKVLHKLNPQLANDSSLLLKHHHLAEIAYQTEDESLRLDQSLLLTESWESDIVVTTFVQFFDSIITNKNKMLKKYHNISGSVIILDEVQNIPIEYWPLVRNVLKLLSEKANCYFVLMTATQPLIFLKKEAFELVKSKTEMFNHLNRVIIKHHPEPKNMEDFAAEFLNSLNPQKSYAIILNTIKSSIEFFKLLEKNLNTGHQLFYLSTNIIPFHRQQRIDEINAHLEDHTPLILVSTQVIEAGLDFDFDVIYRDFAPVDSIVQASGRANRNGEKAEGGEVNLVHLVNENDRKFAQFIYGKAHLYVASTLFEQIDELPEKEFMALVQKNYEDLVKICDVSIGEKIFQRWWYECDHSILSEFRLINEKLNYVNVFISIGEKAQEIWETFLTTVYFEKDIRQRRLNYLKIRKAFNQFIISIPASLAQKHFWDYSNKYFQGIGYIDLEMVENYYNPQIGFIRQTDDEAIFL